MPDEPLTQSLADQSDHVAFLATAVTIMALAAVVWVFFSLRDNWPRRPRSRRRRRSQ